MKAAPPPPSNVPSPPSPLPIKQENLGNQYYCIITTYIRKDKLTYKKTNLILIDFEKEGKTES